MSGILTKIYNNLPVVGQTLAINFYGITTNRRMRSWARILDSIASSETWDLGNQKKYTEKKLRGILAHAINTVPRYESYRGILPELTSPDSNVFALLQELPVITREEILKDKKYFLSRRPPKEKIITTKTSGTTGTPFETFMERSTFTIGDALWWRRNIWAGYKKGNWIARLVGDPIVPLKESVTDRPWRISRTDRRLYLSSFHLSKSNVESYVGILERIRPQFVMGYPSSLAILSSYVFDQNYQLKWKPQKVLFSSEPMYEHQRDIIKKVFRAPIQGLYGCAERIVSAAECEHGSYHLSLVDGYVEGSVGILHKSKPALITGLLNYVMPFIRFQLGDNIDIVTNFNCLCGRTLPVIKPVITKQEDFIETPTGRRISSSVLTWAFKDLQGIKCSQVIQVNKGIVEVHINANEEAFKNVLFPLNKRLNSMFFGEMKINFIKNNSIQVTASGKSRFVINRYIQSNI